MTLRLVAISDRRVTDAERTLQRFAALGHLARPGSVVFQLRDLELSARERLAFGRAMLGVARATEQRFVVNDRMDLAVLLGADGVHLGEAGVATADARRLLGERALVTRACHAPSSAGTLDADAVLLSPVLQARKGRPALGTAALAAARASRAGAGRPSIVALGGVTPQTARACLDAGADGVAVLGFALGDGELGALVEALGIAR